MKLRRPRRKPTVPVNAMSDIAFLLLIFIMLISLINYRQEVPIDYPEAERAEITQADKNLELWVQKSGDLFHDGKRISLRDAEVLIVDAVVADPAVRIHILADRATPYRHVAGVLEVLQTLQHRVVSLVVSESVPQ